MNLILTNDSVLHTDPTTLYKALNKKFIKFGDWLSWEPDVFLKMIGDVTDKLPQNKLMAIQALGGNTQIALEDHIAFESIGNCFCNVNYIVGHSMPLSIEECFYTVKHIKTIGALVHDIPTKNISFFGEIPGYVASCAKHESKRVLPVPLSFGQDILDFLYPNYNVDLIEEHTAIKNIEENQNSDYFNKILEEQPNTFASWVIGCYLFNPTLENSTTK